MGVRKSPAFGRGRGGGRGQVGEWPPRPQAPNLARLFSPGRSLPGPDSRLTCLGPNLPSTLPRSPPQPRALWVSCPPEAPAPGTRRRGGISWRGRGPRHSLLDTRTALTDRHQMLFQAAPCSVRSFRFSTDRRKQGRGGGCRRHEPPHPLASGGGVGGGGWGRSAMAARLSESRALRALRTEAVVSVTSAPCHGYLGTLFCRRVDESLAACVPSLQPSGVI